jgi:ParB-like nuclease domain
MYCRFARIQRIRVPRRHRWDLGDIAALADSIRDVGLLQPLVVSPDHTLVAGRRRLEAVRTLGWQEVPVHVIDGLDDAPLALRAERDENVCRKDFTPSEAVGIGQALEKLERQAAKKRQQRHGGTAPGKRKNTSGQLPEVFTGETRDRVAQALGMSGRTYEKAKAVCEAAAAAPEQFGRLKDTMDRTGASMAPTAV